MIQIEDYDTPIQAAEKIITGTKIIQLTPMMKALRNAVAGTAFEGNETTQDMFDLEEIKEIADYLLVYYNSHPNGD